MQMVPDAVATSEGTMRDRGQEHAALNIALTRVATRVAVMKIWGVISFLWHTQAQISEV
jgi:hypothetical protein